jgi:hypothetical protein
LQVRLDIARQSVQRPQRAVYSAAPQIIVDISPQKGRITTKVWDYPANGLGLALIGRTAGQDLCLFDDVSANAGSS